MVRSGIVASESPRPGDDLTSAHLNAAVGGSPDSVNWIVARFSPLLRANAEFRLGPALRRLYDPEDVADEVWAASPVAVGARHVGRCDEPRTPARAPDHARLRTWAAGAGPIPRRAYVSYPGEPQSTGFGASERAAQLGRRRCSRTADAALSGSGQGSTGRRTTRSTETGCS